MNPTLKWKQQLLFLFLFAACIVPGARAATLTAECSSTHGLYVPGEEIKLTFTAKGLGKKEQSLEVRITDEYDRELSRKTYPVKPDAKGEWRTTIRADQNRFGFFRVYPKLSDGTTIPAVLSRPKGCLTYAVVVDPAKRKQLPRQETFFGLCGNSQDRQYPAWLGTSWCLDGHNMIGGRIWWKLEPNRSGEAMERLKKGEQIEVKNEDIVFQTPGGSVRWKPYGLFDLSYEPQWMRNESMHKFDRSVMGTRPFVNGPLTPAGEKEFIRLCETVAKLRAPITPKGERNQYEFGWEPHYPWNWQGTTDDLIRRYRIGADAVRKYDPNAFVLGPNGAGLTPEYLSWYKELFDKGLGKIIDGVTIHPYPKGYPPESKNMAGLFRTLKQIIREGAGKDLPVFGTELGFMFPGDSEGDLKQMRGFLRSNLILLGEGVRANYNFTMTNIGVEVNYSLVHNLVPSSPWGTPRSTPRTVIPALSALTWLLEGYRSAGPVDGLGENGVGYAYERGDKVVLAVWVRTGKPVRAELAVGRDSIQIADHMGNIRSVRTRNGNVTVTLTEDPQYLLNVSPEVWGSRAFQYIVPDPDPHGTIGGTLRLSGTVHAPDQPLKATLQVAAGEGFRSKEQPVEIPAGRKKRYEILLPVPMELVPGERTVRLTLRSNGKVLKSVYRKIELRPPLLLKEIQPAIRDGKYALKMNLENLSGSVSAGSVTVRLEGIPETGLEKAFRLEGSGRESLVFVWDSPAWNPLKASVADITVRRSDGYLNRVRKRISMMKVPRSRDLKIGAGDAQWKTIPEYKLSGRQYAVAQEERYRGKQDLSATVAAAWNGQHLLFRFRVGDDVFLQPYTGIRTWEADCLQIAFANPETEDSANRLALAHTRKLVEYDFARTRQGDEIYRTVSFDNAIFPAGLVKDSDFQLKTTQNKRADGIIETVYEIAIPWKTLAAKPEPGARIGWAFTVNDRDNEKAESSECVRLGAFDLKKTEWFGTLILAE